MATNVQVLTIAITLGASFLAVAHRRAAEQHAPERRQGVATRGDPRGTRRDARRFRRPAGPDGEEPFRDAGEVCGTGHPANAPGERAEDRPMTCRLAMAGPLNKKPWTNSEHPPQFSGLLGADSAFPEIRRASCRER